MIVTIGTQYLFRGFLLAFVGTVWIMSLPPTMGAFGRLPLFQFESATGATITMPFYFLVLPAAAILTVDIEPHFDGPRDFCDGW